MVLCYGVNRPFCEFFDSTEYFGESILLILLLSPGWTNVGVCVHMALYVPYFFLVGWRSESRLPRKFQSGLSECSVTVVGGSLISITAYSERQQTLEGVYYALTVHAQRSVLPNSIVCLATYF